MDALILSCGTGGGHNSAGFAMKEELKRRGHHVTMLNPYDLRGRRLSGRIDKAYIRVAQRAPWLFGIIYAIGNCYRRLPWRSPVYSTNKRMAKTLQSYLQEHHVDVIIMTHLFPAEILTGMRNMGMDIPKTILIATDYTCIPFMEECACDAYVIPSKKLIGEFEAWGIPAASIHPLGIPVSRRFQASMSQKTAKETLGLDIDKKYLLVSGGSIGAGRLRKTLGILLKITKDTDFRLIVICGNNKLLQKFLEKYYNDEAIVVGQTSRLHLYLQACDLYFTKPGGLSTTEAAVAGKPLILLPPIPGCESRNLRFFTQAGMAVCANPSANELRNTITWFQSDKHREKMLESQRKGCNKNAAEQICRLAEEMV